MREHKVALLPGDGIGPEITKVTEKLLTIIGKKHNIEFSFDIKDFGGNAIETRVFRVTIGDDCKVSRETSAKVSETKASELGLTYGQAKTNLSGASSKMSIRSLGARLGFTDDQTIVLRSSSIARVLLATVSVTACLVFVATRRLFARFDGSRVVGNENKESEEKATLFGGKQPPHSTREFAYGSVI